MPSHSAYPPLCAHLLHRRIFVVVVKTAIAKTTVLLKARIIRITRTPRIIRQRIIALRSSIQQRSSAIPRIALLRSRCSIIDTLHPPNNNHRILLFRKDALTFALSFANAAALIIHTKLRSTVSALSQQHILRGWLWQRWRQAHYRLCLPSRAEDLNVPFFNIKDRIVW